MFKNSRINSSKRLAYLFKKFGLDEININAGIANIKFKFSDEDENAAWELYIEMLTRIVTQPLPQDFGDEKTALESVYALFPITREILRRKGRETINFSKVAILILNQIVRPFTAKWHRFSLESGFGDKMKKKEFRRELEALREKLCKYNRMLAEIACVEDLTNLEQTGENKANEK